MAGHPEGTPCNCTGCEKAPMQSKKFVGYLVAEGTWKVALLIVLIMGMNNGNITHIVGGLALAIVIIAGAVEALYIGGQAGLDKYTRIAQIAANAGHSFEMKGVKLTSNGVQAKSVVKNTPEAAGETPPDDLGQDDG